VSAPLRVVVADDHLLVREGTRQLLEVGGEVEVVGSAGDAVDLVSLVDATEVDAVVTDIRMPPGHHTEGIEAAHRIRATHPDVGVVVLSGHADGAYAMELFRDGTAGLAYLLKDRLGDREQLLAAVRATAAGGSQIDPVVVEALVRLRAAREQSGLDRLTERERTVLERMAAGHTNASIAADLHLSVSAVEKNVNQIFTKLGLLEEDAVHRRVAAVLAWLAGGGR
jgi:DNA-binding NarL/FixJ family response regulator